MVLSSMADNYHMLGFLVTLYLLDFSPGIHLAHGVLFFFVLGCLIVCCLLFLKMTF